MEQELLLKTPEYTRRAIKAYQLKNPEKNREYSLAHYYKNKDDPVFKEKRRMSEEIRRKKKKEMK